MQKIAAAAGLRSFVWAAASAVALVGCGEGGTTAAGTAQVAAVGTLAVSPAAAAAPSTASSFATPLAIKGTPPTTVYAGHTYRFTPVVAAPTGEALRFAIVNRPVWATFSSTTGQLSGTPASTNLGTSPDIVIGVEGGGKFVSLPMFSIQVQSVAPSLQSIALSPVSLRLAPRSSQQLTLMGVYSDATTKPLPAAVASFQSSNPNVASVSAAGVVTVAATASVGDTVSIGASDSVDHLTTSAAASTLITVAALSGAPTPTSAAAATATVKNNPLCGAPVAPFYWEIGDENGSLIGGSEGTDTSGNAVLASTKLSIASASKWIYAAYVVQLRGAADHLNAEDIAFLHFTSGYTNMVDGPGSTCPSTDNPNSVNKCLTLSNPSGVSFSARDPATVGSFDYNSGHMENHASQLTSLGNLAVGSVGPTVQALLGPGVTLDYSEPLMAGGIYASAQEYVLVLRHILDGTLFMHDALGTNQVCTRHSATCNATFSPISEAWHYSIGHWVENDPATNGDAAFSSPGMFGFYPWIDSTKSYYGVISRFQPTGNGVQQGYASAQCGRLIRHAWITGVEQTQPLPTN